MKDIFVNALRSAALFLLFIMMIGYFEGGTTGMQQMLLDPMNWIILAVVVVAGLGIRAYQQRKAAQD